MVDSHLSFLLLSTRFWLSVALTFNDQWFFFIEFEKYCVSKIIARLCLTCHRGYQERTADQSTGWVLKILGDFISKGQQKSPLNFYCPTGSFMLVEFIRFRNKKNSKFCVRKCLKNKRSNSANPLEKRHDWGSSWRCSSFAPISMEKIIDYLILTI